ncbi:MAG TPA: adenylosuccinate synthetase [Candidatus Paceibacterota bacterium]
MIKTDIIVDLQYGDCAKGKVAHHLCKKKKYTHVLRYNGGCNAGHTIYHDGKKFVTHHIPAGVFFGVKSIIGSGCVLDPEQFLKEIKELEDGGIDVKEKIFVARNTHIITPKHKEEDGSGGKIGTTKRGNGPAYRDKYARTGIRAESLSELKPYLIDLYDEFSDGKNKNLNILCEGAQGFGLDIDWGDYPYVTSSHCTTAGALLNGIPYSAVKNVWGVAKIYETYVGLKKFEPNEPIFQKMRDIGEEYGATTGRPRQCNWMNMQMLEKAIKINGVTHAVFSKLDVLEKLKVWKVIDGGKDISFKSEKEMKNYISKALGKIGIKAGNIFFSAQKDRI